MIHQKKILINLHGSYDDWKCVFNALNIENICIIDEEFTTINTENFDVIIPLSTQLINNFYDANYIKNILVICPKCDIFNVFNDKILFSNFMNKHYKNNIPETVDDKNDYPYLAKHKRGV